MRKLLLTLLMITALLSGLNIVEIKAQVQKVDLTLENIFGGKFGQKGFGPVRWLKDGNGYTTLEWNKKIAGQDIVRYDAKTGEHSILVNASSLVPKGETRPLTIRDYVWSNMNDKMLIFTNTRKVWRYHTRGDYWVINLQTGQLTQLGKSVERTSMMFAKFSPDDTKVAYVSNNNIYVEDLNSSIITQITTDGCDYLINGTFDWVYEEEFSARDGFRWSPDSRNIAYWQSDTRGTGTFYMINNLDSIYPKIITVPYPKVGTTNSDVRVGVVSSSGGQTRWFDIPGDPRNNYLPRMEFIPRSNEVMIQQLNRLQNTNTVWIANVNTQEIKTILVDKDNAWVDIHDNIKWLDEEQYFTWTSEKDGWMHLYLVSRDGNQMHDIIKAPMDVVSISCIDEKGGYVYYIASPDNFTQRYLYRSKINGKSEPERITPDDMPGQHSYLMSPDARWAIHTFQNHVTPPVISLVSLPKHKIIRVLEDNHEARQRYNMLGLNPKEFFKVDIGEEVFDAWMIKPKNFDPKKKYAVIFYVYGEPASSTVQDNWGGGDLFHQYMAQQGYIIMSVDNRGTRVPRGAAWRKCIYGKIGITAAFDQRDAALRIEDMFDFVDGDRIGIWGWSGGGQMTLNCLFRFPELYKTGIAVSFVSDQRLYDTIYQERYMGLPSTNPEGYRDGSPINHAQNLEGNLLIIHGTGDDNVHYQSTEWLVNRLVKYGKIFYQLSYPMRTHSISERENTSLHLRLEMEDLWKKNL
ncbi:MAG: S9 family peptidase [Bacteroidales bacterium]|nr:S9 family peptidase [Bacteroidales bacterium]